MKILSSKQVRVLDAYTIANEPVSSWQLMERASRAFVQCLLSKFEEVPHFHIFCGKGNNGGDGLAIARILAERGHPVSVYVVEYREGGTPDFSENLVKVGRHLKPEFVFSEEDLTWPEHGVIIDALLGTGLSKPVEGLLAAVILRINATRLPVVSVDIASGLSADQVNPAGDVIVRPDCTVSFQLPKLCFMLPECAPYVGEWQVIDIGILEEGIECQYSDFFLTTRENLPHLIKKRGKYSHKGTFGHALLVAGSYGRMGAAMLSARACLRSGVGLLTAYVPRCGYQVLQTGAPEAMVLTDPDDEVLTSIPDARQYSAIGVGPGIGTDERTYYAFQMLLSNFSAPMVLDADALNLLAQYPELMKLLPENTILTPHPREFQRLAGKTANSLEAIGVARDLAEKYKIIFCLKGAHTAVVLPDRRVYFNPTGNPGMATGGTGDVLTGIIVALLAQGYAPDIAARLGVFKHGEAGDRAAAIRSEAAVIASDLIENLRWGK